MNISNKIASTLGMIALLVGIPNLAFAVQPCVNIIKEVSADGGMTWHDANTEAEAVVVSNGASYRFTIKRCGWDGLTQVLMVDDVLSLTQAVDDFPFVPEVDENGNWVGPPDLDAEAKTFVVEAPDICKTYIGSVLNTAVVTATGQLDPTVVSDSDDAWIRCEPQMGGGEGCTPGYWKQSQHFDSWPAGITPETSYSSIFDRIITIRTKDAGLVTDPNLLQALSALGGNVNTAARHSTAAYLNSVSGGVSYDLNSDQVISNLQTSIDNNDFGALIEALVNFNEQGCPLN